MKNLNWYFGGYLTCTSTLLISEVKRPTITPLKVSKLRVNEKQPYGLRRIAFIGGGRGIRSCLLQSNLGQQFLCFAKAFGQPLKTTHRVVFLTLSFESLLLSTEKQKRTSKKCLSVFLTEEEDSFNSGAGEFTRKSEASAP